MCPGAVGETEAILQKEAETEMKGGWRERAEILVLAVLLTAPRARSCFSVPGAKHSFSERPQELDWGVLLWPRALTDIAAGLMRL